MARLKKVASGKRGNDEGVGGGGEMARLKKVAGGKRGKMTRGGGKKKKNGAIVGLNEQREPGGAGGKGQRAGRKKQGRKDFSLFVSDGIKNGKKRKLSVYRKIS